MKRCLAFMLLTAVMIFSNLGCRSENKSDNKNITPNTTQTPVVQPSVSQALVFLRARA